MTAPAVQVRSAMITAMRASALLQATAMGATPRVYNRIAPETAFPYIGVTATLRPWDTTSDRGAELAVELRLEGEYEGDLQGETIFDAVRRLFRDWAPQVLANHRLVNLECQFEDVRSGEDGKRYFGLQRWRAVTEET